MMIVWIKINMFGYCYACNKYFQSTKRSFNKNQIKEFAKLNKTPVFIVKMSNTICTKCSERIAKIIAEQLAKKPI